MKKDFNHIINMVEKFEKGEIKSLKLPSDAYYLDEELILIDNPINSGSRFPYAKNGMTIWAYASGYVTVNHSSFYVIPPSSEGKEAYVDFFGIENNEPVSLLGVSENYNDHTLKRYTIFSKTSAYYYTRTKNFVYLVSVYIDQKEDVYFNVYTKNMSDNQEEITLSSYFNMLFKFAERENFETKWFKKVIYEDDTYLYESPEDIDRHTRLDNFGIVKVASSEKPFKNQITTSRMDYVGSRNGSLRNAIPLRTLKFEKGQNITHFVDTAINGDLKTYVLNSGEDVTVSYRISKTHHREEADRLLKEKYDLNLVNNIYQKEIMQRSYKYNSYHLKFKDLNYDDLDEKLLNQFIDLVNYQTHFAALSSNSGTVFLGVRDVMQQLESSLIFDPINSRDKILEVLSFIDSSGLPPRQYSIPPLGANAKMDLRPFIDQGVWIVSTLHTYLSYTGDYQILDEQVGYYDRFGSSEAVKSPLVDSVYEHLLKVTDYLLSQIDENTQCLKILYGDWNDALDGLGLLEGSKDYGNGVSVMASLQLYSVLEQMIEISKYLGQDEIVKKYQTRRTLLKEGILNHAIANLEDEMKVLHGWGHDQSYYVGSFNDLDNKSRDSLTSNAFFVISKMIYEMPEMKEHILNAIKRLDSKYGLRTFNPHFEDHRGFGRIINLPKGTAENAATYVHASLFGALALYQLGASEFANEQIYKVIPITHDKISTSPFIISNSYVYNEEANMDGESMSDWYTGAANTLLKALIRGLFGFEVNLSEVTLKPSREFFSKEAEYLTQVNGKDITVIYKNNNNSDRKFLLNGQEVDYLIDDLNNLKYININKNSLLTKNVIEIID